MKFLITFAVDATLDLEQIWPDGDEMPENPTAEDVRKVFLDLGHGNVLRAAQQWGLEPDGVDVLLVP